MSSPLVCTPLRTEYVALRRPLASRGVRVERTGMGPKRSIASACRLSEAHCAVLVAGVAGSLTTDVGSGEVVVATEVLTDAAQRIARCPTAPVLADAVRRCGFVAHLGGVVTTPRLGGERSRRELAETGALAADMESAYLAELAGGGPYAVLRVIVDTPVAPLARPGTIARGLTSLRILRGCAPAIMQWAQAIRDVSAGEPPPEEGDLGEVSCPGSSDSERTALREVT